MDSSIWVATTTGLPARRPARVIFFCRPGTVSSGSSTPRSPRATISASESSRISVQPLQRLGLFDLGHHGGLAAHQLLQFGHIVGPLHEGQRHPVDAQLKRGTPRSLRSLSVIADTRQQRVGQVHALAVLQLAAQLDDRFGRIRLGGEGAQPDPCRRRSRGSASASAPRRLPDAGSGARRDRRSWPRR